MLVTRPTNYTPQRAVGSRQAAIHLLRKQFPRREDDAGLKREDGRHYERPLGSRALSWQVTYYIAKLMLDSGDHQIGMKSTDAELRGDT